MLGLIIRSAEKAVSYGSSSSNPPTPATPLFLPSEDSASTNSESASRIPKTPRRSPRSLYHPSPQPVYRSAPPLKQIHLPPLDIRSRATRQAECLWPAQEGPAPQPAPHIRLDQSALAFRDFINKARPRPAVVVPTRCLHVMSVY